MSGKLGSSPTRRRPTSRPGSSAAARRERRSRRSGSRAIYAYVNHNLIEAVELGATGHFKVEGAWNDDLMTQVKPPKPIRMRRACTDRWRPRLAPVGSIERNRYGAVMRFLKLKIIAGSSRSPRRFPMPWRARAADAKARARHDRADDRRGELQPAGDFTRMAKPANAPLKTVYFGRGFRIMKRQVTEADYRRCVDNGGCAPVYAARSSSADEPIVGVSWQDAQAYIRWLSGKTGQHYRLPKDDEWAFAAGSRFHDEGWPDFDGADPAKRWLSRYESEAAQEPVDRQPHPVGSFGSNENGLLDVAGNVWEWTDTCFVRIALDAAGHEVSETKNCGVRVVEGRHRTYMTDFIRDARSGGCSVGDRRPISASGWCVRTELSALERIQEKWKPVFRPDAR